MDNKIIDNNKVSCIFSDDDPSLEEKILQVFDYYVNVTMDNI